MRLLTATLILAASSYAYAQDEIELDDDDIELGDDTPEEAPAYDGPPPSGSEEDPSAPKLADDKKREKEEAVIKAKTVIESYPTKYIDRPLTLPSQMVEVEFHTPLTFNPWSVGANLKLDYGITEKVEVGLLYGMGTYHKDSKFEAGKAVGIQTRVGITEDISVEATIPMLFDPFAMSLTIGAPMRFRLNDKLALYLGHDLLSFKISKFMPLVFDPVGNAGLATQADIGTALPSSALTLNLGAGYQLTNSSALRGQISVYAPEFDIDASLYGLSLDYLSTGQRFDWYLGLRSLDLENIDSNLTLLVGLHWRI